MQLTGLELCKDPSESIFRIRIYEFDSTCQCPSRDLSDTVIEVRSKEKSVRIDLGKYDIIIPGRSFFVAIEWLFIPFNEARVKTKVNGRKTNFTYYRPALRFVHDRIVKYGDVWALDFNGEWFENTGSDKGRNFQITAKLR